jgi:hypothetical protein
MPWTATILEVDHRSDESRITVEYTNGVGDRHLGHHRVDGNVDVNRLITEKIMELDRHYANRAKIALGPVVLPELPITIL